MYPVCVEFALGTVQTNDFELVCLREYIYLCVFEIFCFAIFQSNLRRDTAVLPGRIRSGASGDETYCGARGIYTPILCNSLILLLGGGGYSTCVDILSVSVMIGQVMNYRSRQSFLSSPLLLPPLFASHSDVVSVQHYGDGLWCHRHRGQSAESLRSYRGGACSVCFRSACCCCCTRCGVLLRCLLVCDFVFLTLAVCGLFRLYIYIATNFHKHGMHTCAQKNVTF